MDLWVVAAAAGAGYLAKNLQNLPSSEKQRLVESSSKFSIHTSLESKNLLQQIRDKTCPLRRLAQEKGLEDTSDLKKDGFPPGFSGRDNILHNIEFVGNADCSPFELGKFKLLKDRGSTYLIEPLSSLQTGLGSQLQCEEVKEHVHSSIASPWISTMMSLLITEGTENINIPETVPMGMWANGSSSKDTTKNHSCWNQELASPSDSSLDKTNSVEGHSWTSGCTDSTGSPNSMLLFIGITIGIISTIVADENEANSLHEQLKQANSLVQDLQEEIEMKEKLTVKDLADEESLSLKTKNNTSLFNQVLLQSFPEPDSAKHEAGEHEFHSYSTAMTNAKVAENHLLTSEIEAELEVELERLELNMKTSVMDRTDGVTQLDLECEAVTVTEHMNLNLNLNLLSRKYNDDSPKADYDEESENGTEQSLPPNYAVSPRALTIRLHEVIESRLEARIRELETALQNSQNQLQVLETKCIISQDVSSTPESPASA